MQTGLYSLIVVAFVPSNLERNYNARETEGVNKSLFVKLIVKMSIKLILPLIIMA